MRLIYRNHRNISIAIRSLQHWYYSHDNLHFANSLLANSFGFAGIHIQHAKARCRKIEGGILHLYTFAAIRYWRIHIAILADNNGSEKWHVHTCVYVRSLLHWLHGPPDIF